MDIALLRESFEALKPKAADFANQFYKILFNKYPAAKALFEDTDFSQQKMALVGSLAFIIENVDQPEKLVPYLEKMGARHVGYGTKPEHYPLVGDALISTLKYYFRKQWSPELEATWTEAYGAITKYMLDGASKVEKSEHRDSAKAVFASKPANSNAHLPHELTQLAQEVVKEALHMALKKEMNGEFQKLIEDEVRKLLSETIRYEAQNLISEIKKAA